VQGAYEISPVEKRGSTPDMMETHEPEKRLSKEQKVTLQDRLPAVKLKGTVEVGK